MTRRFHDNISGIEISTGVERYNTFSQEEWTIYFLGGETDLLFSQHKIPDQVLRLWKLDEDPEGSEAAKVHGAMVTLLKRGLPFLEVYKKICWLIEQIQVEKKRVDAVIRSIL